MIQKLSSFKEKTLNLIRTNYELGVFHLHNYNISDTIFRLKLVLFFNQNHILAKYHLANCFYIKNNAKGAKKLLEDILDMDENFIPAKYMLQFLQDLSLPEQCNPDIIKNFFNALFDEEHEFIEMIPVHQLMTNLIKAHLTDSEKKLNILDIGCGSGQGFRFIKNSLKVDRSVGVDFSEHSIEALTKQKLYTEAICQDFQLFSDTSPNSFDLIILDSVLHYYKEFSKQLRSIKKLLTKGGVVTFIIEKSQNNTPVTFNYTLNNLCYNKDYINNMLREAKLKMLKIESCKLKNKTLYICLCTDAS